MNLCTRGTSLILIVVISCVSVGQVTNFTETFDGGDANWVNGQFGQLDFVQMGGPDGSSFVSTSLDFEFIPDGSGMGGGQPTPVFFRGHDEFGASGGAFEGNWLTSNVDEVSFSFRHDLPVPVNAFARFSGPGNFPGALYVEFAPTFGNQWTDITVDIDEASFISFEGSDFGIDLQSKSYSKGV